MQALSTFKLGYVGWVGCCKNKWFGATMQLTIVSLLTPSTNFNCKKQIKNRVEERRSGLYLTYKWSGISEIVGGTFMIETCSRVSSENFFSGNFSRTIFSALLISVCVPKCKQIVVICWIVCNEERLTFDGANFEFVVGGMLLDQNVRVGLVVDLGDEPPVDADQFADEVLRNDELVDHRHGGLVHDRAIACWCSGGWCGHFASSFPAVVGPLQRVNND